MITWHRFTTLPPIGPEILICSASPLSSAVCRRVGDALRDAGGYEICTLQDAARDLRGWRWAVLKGE